MKGNFFCILYLAASIAALVAVTVPRTREMAGIALYRDVIQTDDGGIWVYDGDFQIGEKVTVKFDCRHTKKVTDDMVLSVSKTN